MHTVFHICTVCSWLAIFVTLFGHIPAVSAGELPQQDDEATAKFLAEALPAWDKAADELGRVQGSMAIKLLNRSSGDSKWQEWKIQLKQNQRCKLIRTFDHPSMANEVEVVGPAYAFLLNKKAAAGEWVAQEVALPGSPDIERLTGHLESLTRRCWQYAGLSVVSVPLRELATRPSFRVRESRSIDLDGQKFVEVSFENRHDVEENPFCPVQAGLLRLDPQRSWCVRYAKIETGYGSANGMNVHKVFFSDREPNSCIPKKVLISTWVSKSREEKPRKENLEPSTEVTLDLVAPSTLPDDDEFRLSAFGLPEPAGVEPVARRSYWYLWFGFAGLTAILLGFGIRSYRKRTNVVGASGK